VIRPLAFILGAACIFGSAMACGLCRADDARSGLNPLASVSLSDLGATRQKPLFSPSRHPPVPPPPPPAPVLVREPEAPPPVPPAIILLGVVTTADGPRAIIKQTATDKARTIQVGDDVAGWKAAEIEPTRVVLSHDVQNTDVAMFNPKAMRHAKLAVRTRTKPQKR